MNSSADFGADRRTFFQYTPSRTHRTFPLACAAPQTQLARTLFQARQRNTRVFRLKPIVVRRVSSVALFIDGQLIPVAVLRSAHTIDDFAVLRSPCNFRAVLVS